MEWWWQIGVLRSWTMNRPSKTLESILAEAVEIALPDERQAFLSKACGENMVLRAKVEQLMANHFRAGSFLERPAANLHTAAQPVQGEASGTLIGPYKLLEQIGEGGMGVVFVAEQQHPVRREVALKLIKPGMDSKQVIARFEAERQALALMDHPNIAKVLDAGTTDAGRPYFVMELVRGIPITEYCDQARLTVRQRLEVFVQVCRAVQHAHTKGVIHRDLKPSNVLVTSHDGVPVPLVIDFGVAKALGQQLTERTLHTAFALIIGTPMYMSPEQAEFNQLGVDTRSDLYSLGVVLYELLTGATPFDQERLRTADHDELRRVLREEEPPRPSARLSTLGAALSTASDRRRVDPRSLNQVLRGELDWIVMKALEKDRNRRYESASAFAADVQHYLSDEPVEACPPSARYRLKKYVRRNRRLLVPMAVVAMVLMAATLVSAWQAWRAGNAERRAASEAAIVRAVNAFHQDLLQQVGSDPKLHVEARGNRNLTVGEALDRAAATVHERFGNQPVVEAAIQMAIGHAYVGLDESQLAILHLESAVELRQAHLGSTHADTLDSMETLAGRYSWAARYAEAIALRQQVLTIFTATLGPDHVKTLNCQHALATDYRRDGQFERSSLLLENLLDKQRSRCGPIHPDTLNTMHKLALVYADLGRFHDGIALHESFFEGVKSSHEISQGVYVWQMLTFARVCQGAGELERAERLLLEALEQIRKRGTPRRLLAARANARTRLALNMLMEKRYAEAESLAREALKYYEKELPDNPQRFCCMSLLGGVLLAQQRYAESEPLILQGYQGLKQRQATRYIEKFQLDDARRRVMRFYEESNQSQKAHGGPEGLLEDNIKK
jgi:eukaryotic-like serine/threonine-protein kinase